MKKVILLAGGLFLFGFAVNAQTQTATQKVNPPNPDQVKLEQVQYDQTRAANFAAGNVSAMSPADRLLYKEKMRKAQLAAGYLELPGFVFTGDPAVDVPNYEKAKRDYKNGVGVENNGPTHQNGN